MSATNLHEPPENHPRCAVPSCNKPLTDNECICGGVDIDLGNFAPPGVSQHVDLCEKCYDKLCDAVEAVFEGGK